jgi:hypothetical protein
VFSRALGGRVDGLEINLFSQARALNRGWSAEGKLFRRMEQHCAARLLEGIAVERIFLQ